MTFCRCCCRIAALVGIAVVVSVLRASIGSFVTAHERVVHTATLSSLLCLGKVAHQRGVIPHRREEKAVAAREVVVDVVAIVARCFEGYRRGGRCRHC